MTHSARLTTLSVFGLLVACSSTEPGGDSVATTGGASAKGGSVATAGGASAGGATAKGGTPASGGVMSTGGASTVGGSLSAGGAAATGGKASTGGTSTGGATTGGSATGGVTTGGRTASGDECPLTLEGFATVNADGQNGTNGGGDGETVTVSTLADLTRYATATEPYTIQVEGKITISPKGTEIRVSSDKTIIGVGTTGEISEGGFFLNGVHNVIIRNLTIGNTATGTEADYDGIQMDTAHHVWIDHCTFHDINDGMIDSRKDTTYVTTSWNILHDHNKAYGIGWTPNVTAQMTIHHNILRDTHQRNPSTDNVLRAHLYNNWMLRIGSYGNYSRGGTNMVIENSVFDQVKDPYYYDTGTLVAIGNILRNTTGQQESSGSTYSFFEPSKFYQYTLDPASEVEALLTKCAGPLAELGNF